MRSIIRLLVIAAFWGSALAQEPAPVAAAERNPAAIEILKQVDQAAKAVNAVRYSATATPSGVATNFVTAAEGEAVMEGWSGNLPAKFRTRVKTKRPGSEEAVELTGGGNGQVYYLIDHQSKKAYADMDPGVMGKSGRTIQAFAMVEFVHDAPFDDELNAETIQLLEEAEVSGEPCDQIRVVYSGNQGESIWLFSKKDHLPRRRIQKFSIPGQGEGSVERTVTKLEVNPQLDPKLFDFQLPEGYQKIDDFAP